ncbi:hypothetical protein [Ruegeria sp. HKCCD6157]|uniref:hypothetical protein n=1 Tax=Ruegeria sp. HKCCD6157 TaxID=2690707 RepID=UPI0019E56401|nr:hypothetical protein [Ruegeria sp. HKCCD6157]NOE25100.1 hypothetical protein [Ruegeria sp. HKCCD6157]
MIQNGSFKESSSAVLGVDYQAAGLAVALDNAIFLDNCKLQDVHLQALEALDGIEKALYRSTDVLLDQI